jgi:hypothetical protein
VTLPPEPPPTRGYLTHAFNHGEVDYLRMAYCLALSLRLTQSEVTSLSVIVADSHDVPAHYRDVFDRVITVPDARPAFVRENWRVDNFVHMYDLTPYDQTVTLDADMLFFDDVSPWWNRLGAADIAGATAVTYRGDVIVDNPLRANLYEIGLPDLHNGFFFFQQGNVAQRLFATMTRYLDDWDATCHRHFGRTVPFSSDCALLLSIRDTGVEDISAGPEPGIPRFVHMKACLQGWPGVAPTEREWRRHAGFRFDQRLRLFIDGVRIGDPFHYHVRDFVTDELLRSYEIAATEGVGADA